MFAASAADFQLLAANRPGIVVLNAASRFTGVEDTVLVYTGSGAVKDQHLSTDAWKFECSERKVAFQNLGTQERLLMSGR